MRQQLRRRVRRVGERDGVHLRKGARGRADEHELGRLGRAQQRVRALEQRQRRQRVDVERLLQLGERQCVEPIERRDAGGGDDDVEVVDAVLGCQFRGGVAGVGVLGCVNLDG